MNIRYDQFPFKAELERRVFASLSQETIIDNGTFLQAMVLANGNETQAKVKYYELRFRQLEECGGLEPYILEILSEQGELCHICKQQRKRGDKIVPLLALSPAQWAHSKCLETLRMKDQDSAIALVTFNSKYCAICYLPINSYYKTAIYKGRFVKICYDHIGKFSGSVYGNNICSLCGGKYSIFKEAKQKKSVFMLNENNLSKYCAHYECKDKLIDILKNKSL